MVWSMSADKMFRRCQRQWFYKQVFGNANARKDPLRYEAYLLSKLQTISAIRGQAVDEALSERLVPALQRGFIPRCTDLQQYARQRLEVMLSYAKEHPLEARLADPGKLPDHFALLYDYEYGEGIAEEEYERAFSDADISIENLFELEELLQMLSRSERIVSQRALTWKVGGSSVRAVPDVIAFYSDSVPIVLDWKVHFFASADAARQLASYSLALARANPHRDFPSAMGGWPETETRLLEVQLLKGEVREHEYTADEYEELEQWIAGRTVEVDLAIHGRKKSSDFRPEDFPTAFDGRPCGRCNFKRLCWNQESA